LRWGSTLWFKLSVTHTAGVSLGFFITYLLFDRTNVPRALLWTSLFGLLYFAFAAAVNRRRYPVPNEVDVAREQGPPADS
jgi:hypothetical protein